MVIKTQDEKAIYDLDKLVSVYALEDKETGETTVLGLAYGTNMAYPFGVYKHNDRAKEIIGEIFALCHSSTLYEMPIV